MMNVIVLPAGTYDFAQVPELLPIVLPSDVRVVGGRVVASRGARKAALRRLLPTATSEQLERVLGH